MEIYVIFASNVMTAGTYFIWWVLGAELDVAGRGHGGGF